MSKTSLGRRYSLDKETDCQKLERSWKDMAWEVPSRAAPVPNDPLPVRATKDMKEHADVVIRNADPGDSDDFQVAASKNPTTRFPLQASTQWGVCWVPAIFMTIQSRWSAWCSMNFDYTAMVPGRERLTTYSEAKDYWDAIPKEKAREVAGLFAARAVAKATRCQPPKLIHHKMDEEQIDGEYYYAYHCGQSRSAVVVLDASGKRVLKVYVGMGTADEHLHNTGVVCAGRAHMAMEFLARTMNQFHNGTRDFPMFTYVRDGVSSTAEATVDVCYGGFVGIYKRFDCQTQSSMLQP